MTGSLLDQLVPLIPVVAGALIALAGGWIKYWVDRREQRKTRRREKLERLLSLVYGLKAWTDNLESRLAFGTSNDEIASPVEEIEVLGHLYFHDLHSEVDAVTRAAKLYMGAMYSLAAERFRTGEISPHADAKIAELFPPILDGIRAFTVKARPIAKELS